MSITEIYPDYVEIGYTKKSFGICGQVKLFVEPSYLPGLKKADHCFLFIEGCMVPYFIVSKEEELEDGIISFDWVKTPEEAKAITGKKIFLRKSALEGMQLPGSKLVFDFLKGYALYDDATDELIGEVVSVNSYPEQEMATVVKESDCGEMLIPLNTINIKAINEEERAFWMEIPEGLLDL